MGFEAGRYADRFGVIGEQDVGGIAFEARQEEDPFSSLGDEGQGIYDLVGPTIAALLECGDQAIHRAAAVEFEA